MYKNKLIPCQVLYEFEPLLGGATVRGFFNEKFGEPSVSGKRKMMIKHLIEMINREGEKLYNNLSGDMRKKWWNDAERLFNKEVGGKICSR